MHDSLSGESSALSTTVPQIYEGRVLMHSLIFGKEGPPPSSSVRVLMRFTAPTKNPLRARRRVGGQMPPPSLPQGRTENYFLSLSLRKNETLHSHSQAS